MGNALGTPVPPDVPPWAFLAAVLAERRNRDHARAFQAYAAQDRPGYPPVTPYPGSAGPPLPPAGPHPEAVRPAAQPEPPTPPSGTPVPVENPFTPPS
jgi:hypothetical protein